MPYLIFDDLTQSVIDGPYQTSAEAEEAKKRIDLDSAFVAEVPAPEPTSRPGMERIEELRRRWLHVAGGHWVAAYNALRRRDWETMRREAGAAKDARANADPMVGSVFGPPPSVPRGLERYEEAGARYEREIPRIAGAVGEEMRRHEAWRREMRIWEREARRRGGDPRQMFREFHQIADSLGSEGTKYSVILRRSATGTAEDHECKIEGALISVCVPFDQRLDRGCQRRALVSLREHGWPPRYHRAASWERWEDE